jgi:hypothetical protein
MAYAEASYFDGYHFQHIAAWQDHQRLARIAAEGRKLFERRRHPR